MNADYEECKQKLNLVENFSTDLQNRYEEAKHEITQLQNSVLRYFCVLIEKYFINQIDTV